MSKNQIVRGILDRCLLCNKKYNLFTKEHICKRCMRSVCSECTSQKQLVFQKKQQKRNPHRLCKACKPQSDFIENYHRHYKIIFNTTSSVGKQWGSKILRENIIHPPQYQKPKKDPLKSRADIWSSLTFSFKNFVGNIVFDLDYYTPLKSVYDKCSYSNCSQYVVLFFLCHCDQQLTLDLINILMCNLQQNPPSKQAVYQNLQFLGCNSSQINSLKYYIEYKFHTFMKDLSLNHLTAEVSLFIISGMVSEKKPKNSLQKCFSIMIFTIREVILKNGIDFQKTQLQTLQTIKSQDFQANMRVLLNKQKLQEQANKLKSESVTLRQSFRKLSEERSNSMASESEMSRTLSTNEVEQLNTLRGQNPQLKSKMTIDQNIVPKKLSSDIQNIKQGPLSTACQQLQNVMKGLSEDMSEIERLNKELLQCLGI